MEIYKLLRAGEKHIRDEFLSEEAKKLGILRAGNTGIVLPDGTPAGSCPRATYLRFKGIQTEEVTASRELMFEAGRSNEDQWVDVLKHAWDGPILQEEEVGIKWETDNGVAVTGRPDVVLAEGTSKEDSRPVKGLELKLVSSVWTARDVLNLKPKANHLMQAAHYSWQLGVPFDLWYTARADYAITGWMQRHFPKRGEPASVHCEYNDKGDIKKVLPFRKGFEIELRGPEGRLYFRPIVEMGPEKEFVETVITVDGIKAFYNMVATMEEKGTLPPPAVMIDYSGEKLGWSVNTYSPIGDLSIVEGKSLDEWTASVLQYLHVSKGIINR